MDDVWGEDVEQHDVRLRQGLDRVRLRQGEMPFSSI